MLRIRIRARVQGDQVCGVPAGGRHELERAILQVVGEDFPLLGLDLLTLGRLPGQVQVHDQRHHSCEPAGIGVDRVEDGNVLGGRGEAKAGDIGRASRTTANLRLKLRRSCNSWTGTSNSSPAALQITGLTSIGLAGTITCWSTWPAKLIICPFTDT